MDGDYGRLSGAQLFSLAMRLPAYPGMMQLVARAEYAEKHAEHPPVPQQRIPAGTIGAGTQTGQTIDLTPDLLASGQFSDLIEFR